MYLLLLLSLFQSTPSDPAKWMFSSENADGVVNVQLQATLEEGWHLYAISLPSDQGPIATSFTFKNSSDWVASGEMIEPVPVEEYDMNFAMDVRHHSGSPVFVLPIKRATDKTFTVEGELEYMVCNNKTCLPPKVVPFSIVIPAISVK